MKRDYIKPEAEVTGIELETGLLVVSGDLYGGSANAAGLPDIDDIGQQTEELLDGYLLKE